MKSKILLSAIFAFISLISMAQQPGLVAMKSIVRSASDEKSNNSATGSAPTPKYTLESYGTEAALKAAYMEEHFLGEAMARKWGLFVQNYKREYEQSVGFSNSSVEIIKPTVFNAVNKISGYLKKALKKGDIDTAQAYACLEHVLNCANLICYEENTKDIETEIKNAKTAEEIVKVFDSIRIVYH